jgi:hypothetical protein
LKTISNDEKDEALKYIETALQGFDKKLIKVENTEEPDGVGMQKLSMLKMTFKSKKLDQILVKFGINILTGNVTTKTQMRVVAALMKI